MCLEKSFPRLDVQIEAVSRQIVFKSFASLYERYKKYALWSGLISNFWSILIFYLDVADYRINIKVKIFFFIENIFWWWESVVCDEQGRVLPPQSWSLTACPPQTRQGGRGPAGWPRRSSLSSWPSPSSLSVRHNPSQHITTHHNPSQPITKHPQH